MDGHHGSGWAEQAVPRSVAGAVVRSHVLRVDGRNLRQVPLGLQVAALIVCRSRVSERLVHPQACEDTDVLLLAVRLLRGVSLQRRVLRGGAASWRRLYARLRRDDRLLFHGACCHRSTQRADFEKVARVSLCQMRFHVFKLERHARRFGADPTTTG